MKTAEQRLEQELQDLYKQVPAPPQGLLPGRERLVAEATLLRQQRPVSMAKENATKTIQRRPNMKFVLMYKLIAAVMAIVMGTTAVSGGVALAANDSLPGDALYGVKLGIEDMRLALLTDPAAQAELNLVHAQKRIQEMERLLSENRLMPEEALARMMQSTERAMVRTAYAEPEQTAGLLAQIVTTTEAQERLLQQAMATAPADAQTALRHALQVTQQTRLQAQEGAQDPEGFRQQVRKRAEEHLGPAATPSPSGAQERNREQEQNRNGDVSPTVTPLQNRNGTATPVGTPQQNREQEQNRDQTVTCTPQHTREREQDQNRDQTPTCTPQQDREQERNRTQAPQATHTPEPTATRQAAQTPGPMQTPTPQGTREQEQNRVQTATVTPAQTQAPQPTHTHVPTATPQGPQGPNSTCTPAPQGTPQQGGNGAGKP